MHYHILINPVGASGKTKAFFEEKIRPRFDASRHTYTVHYSAIDRKFDKIVEEILRDAKEPQNIVVIGGDGTFNDAINGITDFSLARFAFIPSGSANDLAKDLGILGQTDQLLEKVFEGKVRRVMDIGMLVYHNQTAHLNVRTKTVEPADLREDIVRYFNNGASVGFDAEICEKVEISKAKGALNKIGLGKLVYLYHAIGLIFTAKRTAITMEFDDGRIRKIPNCLFAVGMNHRYEGGGFMFGPNAKDDDGMLDFTIAAPKHNAAFFRGFPLAYNGNHFRLEGVDEEIAKEVRIRLEKPMWVQTDGEISAMSSDVTIKVLPRVLQLLI